MKDHSSLNSCHVDDIANDDTILILKLWRFPAKNEGGGRGDFYGWVDHWTTGNWRRRRRKKERERERERENYNSAFLDLNEVYTV